MIAVVSLPLPSVVNDVGEILEMDESTVTFRRVLSEEEGLFEGHFPNMPILPGVFIYDFFQKVSELYFSNKILPNLTKKEPVLTLSKMRSIRFFSALSKNDTLQGKINMKVSSSTVFASGVILDEHGSKVASLKVDYCW